MKKANKKKFTLTLDEELVNAVRGATGNLSETVCILLRELIQKQDNEKFISSLVEYEDSAKERRKKIGVFSDSTRKFL